MNKLNTSAWQQSTKCEQGACVEASRWDSEALVTVFETKKPEETLGVEPERWAGYLAAVASKDEIDDHIVVGGAQSAEDIAVVDRALRVEDESYANFVGRVQKGDFDVFFMAGAPAVASSVVIA